MTDEPSEPQPRSRRWLSVLIVVGLACAAYFGFRAMILASADETVAKAQQAVSDGNTEQARSMLGWLLYFDSNHKGALMAASASYARDQRTSEAIALFDRIPESDLKPDEQYVKSMRLIDDGQWDRAEELLVAALSDDEANELLVDQLARLYISQMRRDDAVELLDRYLIASGKTTTLMSLLELLAVSQSPDAYVGPLGAADKRWPGQKSVTLGLATCYMLSGQTESAAAKYEKSVELRPDDLDVQLAAAAFRLASGGTTKAETLLDRAEANPVAREDHRFWFLKARIAEAAGDVSTAAANIDRAISLAVPREAYLQTSARLARRLGQRDRGVTIGAKAAQLAQQRQRLMKLFPAVDSRIRKPELFNEIAGIVESLGYPQQAARWRELATRSSM